MSGRRKDPTIVIIDTDPGVDDAIFSTDEAQRVRRYLAYGFGSTVVLEHI